MPGNYSLVQTVTTGQIITAGERNSEHQNHIDNATPTGVDDQSASLSEMQGQTDPYPGGTASLATNLKGELERIRYRLAQLSGQTYWYQAGSGIASFKYRRPNLVWVSATTVELETGLNGTAGAVPMVFPDGSLRVETSSTRYRFDITRNAVLAGTTQSGLRTSLSEATNTWYYLYAVKVTDNSTDWCMVGDTLAPTQTNYATLNTNFGTDGWRYLGCVPNGDGAGATGDIKKFRQIGPWMFIHEEATTGGWGAGNSIGVRLAYTASATTLNWGGGAGSTVGSQVPETAKIVQLLCIMMSTSSDANRLDIGNNSGTYTKYSQDVPTGQYVTAYIQGAPDDGIRMSNGDGDTCEYAINLTGYVDTVLTDGLLI